MRVSDEDLARLEVQFQKTTPQDNAFVRGSRLLIADLRDAREALRTISHQQAGRVQDGQCVICGRQRDHLCEGCIADKALGDPVFKS